MKQASNYCIKNFNVGVHSDVYELIWFKFGVMMDTVKHTSFETMECLSICSSCFVWSWSRKMRKVCEGFCFAIVRGVGGGGMQRSNLFEVYIFPTPKIMNWFCVIATELTENGTCFFLLSFLLLMLMCIALDWSYIEWWGTVWFSSVSNPYLNIGGYERCSW